MIRKYFDRIWQLLAKALQQGITPRKLAVTCALGAVLAIFPVYGLTTLLCFIAAFALRLNMVVIQTVNYLLTPVQLMLIIPFMHGGIYLFNLKALPLSLDELVLRFQHNFWQMLDDFGGIVLGGIVVWLLAAIPVFIILFFVTHMALRQWKAGSARVTDEI